LKYVALTLAAKTTSGCSSEECLGRSAIPEELQAELSGIGGIRGLCERIPPDEKIQHISALHHALSDPVRVKILHLVSIQPLCVCVIKTCLGISDSKLSYHLTILKKAALIEGKQQGNWIIYSITDRGASFAGKSEKQSYPSYYTLAE
jgi:ArsR family transcriptional regulator, arsenate/arsenite/antimonite-responsive transcriptional repressor